MYWLLQERQRRPAETRRAAHMGSAAASTAASTGERNERRGNPGEEPGGGGGLGWLGWVCLCYMLMLVDVRC